MTITPVDRYNEAFKEYLKVYKTRTKNQTIQYLRDKYNDLSSFEIELLCNVDISPKKTSLLVGPNDWGIKFVLHANRGIELKYVKIYEQKLAGVLNSTFHLLDLGNGVYRILDGQHRILALCNLAKAQNTKHRISCIVYPIHHFTSEQEICDQIGEINFQRKQTNGHTLEINRHQSPWYNRAKVSNMCDLFGFKQSRHTITWSNVCHSHIIMNNILNSKSFCNVKSNVDERLKHWLNTDMHSIDAYYEFLNWYYPYADAIRNNLKILSFHNSEAIAIVACVYFKYKTTMDLNPHMERLVSNPQLAQLRLSGTQDIAHAARIILGAMNYRVITKIVDLFGETGR